MTVDAEFHGGFSAYRNSDEMDMRMKMGRAKEK